MSMGIFKKTFQSRKLLFILKKRSDYNNIASGGISMATGLYNSASYMVDMLTQHGHEAVIELAVDNNDIDRLVTAHQPTHVIIEALWVVPTKFQVLCQLHPSVTWIIRLHSDMPFLAGEGMAMEWIGDYATYPQVLIAPNSQRMHDELGVYLANAAGDRPNRLVHLPNYYPVVTHRPLKKPQRYYVDISCFGAVRPMKNHLLQAVAALKFANDINKQLRFHINTGRIEGKGDSVMRNLIGLFAQVADSGHQLIAHEWMPRDEFVSLCGRMDIAMQVSFSETFNIVAADHVCQGVPLVSSAEIAWSHGWWQAAATDSRQMVRALHRAHRYGRLNTWLNQQGLAKYCQNSRDTWLRWLR
jgi:hypothetical protein